MTAVTFFGTKKYLAEEKTHDHKSIARTPKDKLDDLIFYSACAALAWPITLIPGLAYAYANWKFTNK